MRYDSRMKEQIEAAKQALDTQIEAVSRRLEALQDDDSVEAQQETATLTTALEQLQGSRATLETL